MDGRRVRRGWGPAAPTHIDSAKLGLHRPVSQPVVLCPVAGSTKCDRFPRIGGPSVHFVRRQTRVRRDMANPPPPQTKVGTYLLPATPHGERGYQQQQQRQMRPPPCPLPPQNQDLKLFRDWAPTVPKSWFCPLSGRILLDHV